jgi:hypothetical protein
MDVLDKPFLDDIYSTYTKAEANYRKSCERVETLVKCVAEQTPPVSLRMKLATPILPKSLLPEERKALVEGEQAIFKACMMNIVSARLAIYQQEKARLAIILKRFDEDTHIRDQFVAKIPALASHTFAGQLNAGIASIVLRKSEHQALKAIVPQPEAAVHMEVAAAEPSIGMLVAAIAALRVEVADLRVMQGKEKSRDQSGPGSGEPNGQQRGVSRGREKSARPQQTAERARDKARNTSPASTSTSKTRKLHAKHKEPAERNARPADNGAGRGRK